MLELTTAIVHTTGINWESVGAILGGVAAFLTVVGAFVSYIIRGVRLEIKDSVEQLGIVLTERLETKQSVAALTVRVAVLESKADNGRR